MLLTHTFKQYFSWLIVLESNWLGNEKWLLHIRIVPGAVFTFELSYYLADKVLAGIRRVVCLHKKVSQKVPGW